MASQQCKCVALAMVGVTICAMGFVALGDVRAKKRRKLAHYLVEHFDPHDLQDFIEGSEPPEKVPMLERFWMRRGQHLRSRTFFTLFRMMRPTFKELVEELYGTTAPRAPENGNGRIFNPCERVAMVLFRLGQGATIRATAALFEISDGYVTKYTPEVVQAVKKTMQLKYVAWPTPSEQDYISKAFQKRTGMKNVVGAIDGSHIPIPAPSEAAQGSYYNYKGFFSVVLVAIVDNDGLFRWICAGAPGSCGDGEIFKWSRWYKKLIADQSKPASSRRLITKGRVILGDSAFANCEWLLCPYDAPATRHQRFYNYKHSGTRFVVEHAFGRLKWKFMAMKNRMFFYLDSVPDVIVCCVALYNSILLHEGIGRGEVFTDDTPTRSDMTATLYFTQAPDPAFRRRERGRSNRWQMIFFLPLGELLVPGLIALGSVQRVGARCASAQQAG
ncbi:unnamed protein product [Ascophyllum nodosum]